MTRVPWTIKARLDALELRRAGMPYTSIAIALGHFHGFTPSPDSIRYICILSGVTRPVGHRGNTANLRRVA